MSNEIRVTKLLPVGTKTHGADHYLVRKDEFNAREDQVYALAGKYDDAVERLEATQALLAEACAKRDMMTQAFERMRADIAERVGAVL